jgi:hypothetical protein
MSAQPEAVSDPEPDLTPKLLTADDEFLERAIEKWLKFQTGMWDNVNLKLQPEIKSGRRWSITLRLIIILLSAAVTTVSNIDTVARTAVTILAGTLTALTGIEAFLRAGERQSDAQKQQREIEALRDKLRYEWFVRVEIEGDMAERLKAAKDLLQRGPNEYNEILSKYALKAENPDRPHLNA